MERRLPGGGSPASSRPLRVIAKQGSKTVGPPRARAFVTTADRRPLRCYDSRQMGSSWTLHLEDGTELTGSPFGAALTDPTAVAPITMTAKSGDPICIVHLGDAQKTSVPLCVVVP